MANSSTSHYPSQNRKENRKEGRQFRNRKQRNLISRWRDRNSDTWRWKDPIQLRKSEIRNRRPVLIKSFISVNLFLPLPDYNWNRWILSESEENEVPLPVPVYRISKTWREATTREETRQISQSDQDKSQAPADSSDLFSWDMILVKTRKPSRILVRKNNKLFASKCRSNKRGVSHRPFRLWFLSPHSYSENA